MKQVIATIAIDGRPFFIALSPDGARAYTCNNESGTVSVIDTAAKKMIGTIRVAVTTAGMAISPSSTEIYVVTPENNGPAAAAPGGAVRVIDTARNKLSANILIEDHPLGLAIHPDGSRLYVGCQGNHSVKVIDLATASVTATIDVSSVDYWLAVSPNGSHLYLSSGDTREVTVIDTATNLVTARIPLADKPWAIAVSPDNARVYVGAGQLNTPSVLYVIDASSKAISATIPMAGAPLGAAFSQDGHHIYVSNGHTLSVIATATNSVVQTVKIAGLATGVVISPAQQRIYVANGDYGFVAVIADVNPPSIEEALARLRWWLDIVLPRYLKKPPRPISFTSEPS